MLYAALVVIYVVICFFLILVVLLQQGKGADIAGAFGGGGSQTAFGARGATTFLHKLTTGAFVGFVVLSVLLSILEARPRCRVHRAKQSLLNDGWEVPVLESDRRESTFPVPEYVLDGLLLGADEVLADELAEVALAR